MAKHIVLDFTRVLCWAKNRNLSRSYNLVYHEERQKEGFKFEDHFYLKDEIINKLKELKSQGYKLYIFAQGNILFDTYVQEYLKDIIEPSGYFSPEQFQEPNKMFAFPEVLVKIGMMEGETDRENILSLYSQNTVFIEKEKCNISGCTTMGLKTLNLYDHYFGGDVLKALDAAANWKPEGDELNELILRFR